MRQKVVLISVAILLGSCIYVVGRHLDYLRYSGEITEELMYFPSGRMLQFVSPGFHTVMSDLLWLRGIQYYGQHRRSDQEYLLAEHIFSTITDFDPLFVEAYRFGGFVLAQDAGQPAAGIDLLRKGMRNNPDRWELPFDLGFLYFVILKDHSKAAHYFRFASRFKDAPDIARRFTAFAYRKAGKTDVALALWQEIYNSTDNRVMKETAFNAIGNIKIEKTCNELGNMVERFVHDEGRYPLNLEELVSSGYIAYLPKDPFGGDYYFDRDLRKVLSETRVTREASHAIEFIGHRVETYKSRYGVFPDSLDVLVREGFIAEIPSVEGASLQYDPSTGKVLATFSWEKQK